MTKINDGGHAFPNITPDMNVDGGPGMTLRDYFAAQALGHVMDSLTGTPIPPGAPFDAVAGVVAEHAYALADAMLKAREASS